MNNHDIISLRLVNQQILATKFTKPGEIVAWMGAMQAQEYAMAKWAIGLRLSGTNEADIDRAFNEGTILRTHLLRPTWHFVTPADIRWLLTLTAPRVRAANAFMYRKLEIDLSLFKRSQKIFIKSLEGGNQLTRAELKQYLTKAKILAEGPRLGYLLMHAELEGILCSGALKGKQFTYALLDERVPGAHTLTREEALAELSCRYFSSRGPATVYDYSRWSGLTISEAKMGASMLDSKFVQEVRDGSEYIYPGINENNKPSLKIKNNPLATFLLPDYDEYGMSYRDRSAIFSDKVSLHDVSENEPDYNHSLVIDGIIEGIWRRTIQGTSMQLVISTFAPLTKLKHKSVVDAAQRYSAFFEKTPEIHINIEN